MKLFYPFSFLAILTLFPTGVLLYDLSRELHNNNNNNNNNNIHLYIVPFRAS